MRLNRRPDGSSDRSTVPDDSVASLRQSVTRGLGWSLINSVVGRAGQLVVGIVLARLLSPKDFGIYAVALVAYTVVISCSELGVSVALIRRPDDGPRLGPTVTTLTWISSSVLVLGLWFASPTVAAQLNAPQATGVLRVLSLAILVAGISAVPGALVQRDFQQGARFGADMVNLVVSTLVVVFGALDGHGAYALAWSRVAGNAASAVILYAVANERYRPGFDRVIARELLIFGVPLAGASVLAFAVMNVDNVVISKIWGPTVLGYYVLAFNLSGWPVSAFSMMARSVSLPAFARLRDQPLGAGEAFVAATRWLLAASVLVSVMLAVLARPAIQIVYGARWGPAAVPLMFLAALGTFRVLHELAYDYLVALGSTRTVLIVQVGWLAGLVVLLPIGARAEGLAGVGMAHLVVAGGVVLPMYAVALRRNGVSLAAVARTSAWPLIAGGGALLTTYTLAQQVESDLTKMLLGGGVGSLVYLLLVLPALPERVQAWAPHLRIVRQRRRPPAPTRVESGVDS